MTLFLIVFGLIALSLLILICCEIPNKYGFIWTALGLILAMTFGIGVERACTEKLRNQAIKAGAGYWTAPNADGEQIFMWGRPVSGVPDPASAKPEFTPEPPISEAYLLTVSRDRNDQSRMVYLLSKAEGEKVRGGIVSGATWGMRANFTFSTLDGVFHSVESIDEYSLEAIQIDAKRRRVPKPEAGL